MELFVPPRRDIRGYRAERCPACRMIQPHCVCELLTGIESKTRIRILMHNREAPKTTNTGFYVQAALTNAEVVPYAVPGVAFDDSVVDDRSVVLFPHEAARPIGELELKKPITLIVPDGTWRQARRMVQRQRALREAQKAVLPTAALSGLSLRNASRPGHVSTLEAVARALGVLESPDIEARLLDLLRAVVTRTQYARGNLPASAMR